jgi:hypothetical protein
MTRYGMRSGVEHGRRACQTSLKIDGANIVSQPAVDGAEAITPATTFD